MYSNSLLKRLQNLEYAGIVTNADAVGQVGSIALGDMIKLYLRIVDENIITEAKFKAFGGVYTLVGCDLLCDLLINTSLETALTIKGEDIITALGDLPKSKLHVADLIQLAVVDAIDDYRKKLAKLKSNQEK